MAEKRQAGSGLDTPMSARDRFFPRFSPDPDAFGSSTEKFARFMGTPQFLVYMSIFCIFWLIWNTWAPEAWRFDSAALGFTALTLMLSLQASYAAPLLLLAQNRQDDRDKVSLSDDRGQAERNLADTEYLTRELAALRIALRDVATRDYVRSELRSALEELLETADGEELRLRAKNPKRRDRTSTNTGLIPQVAKAPKRDKQEQARQAAGQASREEPTLMSIEPRLLEALAAVQDPELRRPITELGMVESAVLDNGTARVTHPAHHRRLPAALHHRKRRHRRTGDPAGGRLRGGGPRRDEPRTACGPPRVAQGPRGALRRPCLADPGHRHRQRQGRGRQVLADRQPGLRHGRRRAARGPHRRRRARLLHPRPARHRRRQAHPRGRDDPAARRPRREGHLHRHVCRRQQAGDLARADAAPCPRAIPHRRALRGPRRAAARPAPGHRGHRHFRLPAASGLRAGGRHDPAGRGRPGRRACRRHRRADGPEGPRRHREHELAADARRLHHGDLRLRRRRGSSANASRQPSARRSRCSGRSRWTRCCAPAAMRGCRWCSRTPTPPRRRRSPRSPVPSRTARAGWPA